MAARTYHDMFRPVYETTACAGWIGSTAALAIASPPFWAGFALSTMALACLRGRQALDIYKFRTSISHERVKYMTPQEVVEISQKLLAERKALWLGTGFRWT